MKNKTAVNDSSINSAGIPKDYKQALAELIWNGYDAGATTIDIRFNSNEIDHIDSIVVSDNGEGINFETLHDTFGAFLDSVKKNSFQRSSYNRGKKGKGRFSFATFAGKATWHTIYKSGEKLLEYDIVISKNSKDQYEDKDRKVSKSKQTGTEVILEELFEVTGFSFLNDEFREFLAQEFGWFLFLNKENNYSLCINGTPIQYKHIIADSDEFELIINAEDGFSHKFLISYIRWQESIGDRYYYYFLNKQKRESAKKLTSFNNNAIEFHHSVYVQSDFFNDFILAEGEGVENDLFGRNHNDPVFRTLVNNLHELLNRKQKGFIRLNAAEDLVVRMESKGVFPRFSKNKYDLERKKDLTNVVKELYCVEPRIFKGLRKEQEITFLGFLNLLLDTEEREHIIDIIESIVRLTGDERAELANVLSKTTFSKIVNTIRLIENRFSVVEMIRTLVFDLKKFSTERDHIQKVIEENYWLFGEQYHLTSADGNFHMLLSNYLYIIDGEEEKEKSQTYNWKRRPDIFICRKRNVPDTHDNEYELEENIMVELKRPTVTITKKEFRQIDDYLDIILKDDRFNSQLRKWKFYVISNKVDDYIEKQYTAFKDKGKRFLVQQAGRYEIYAMTWDDLFKTFEVRHKYLLDKLEYDKSAIQEEMRSKGILLNREGSNQITKEVVNLKVT